MRSRRHWEKGNGTVMEIFGMGGTSRQRKAFFAALVGLIINLILGMVKIFAGWQSGFLSVIGGYSFDDDFLLCVKAIG